MKKKSLHLAVALLCLLPFAYLAAIYQDLPESVPTHFNLKGEPDDYSQKSSLRFFTGLLAAITIVLYLLMRNIHRIDPKRSGQLQSSTFNKLGFGIAVILTVVNFTVISSAAGHFDMLNEFVLLGLVFAVLGNFMHSIKPNYFAGFRLPWTLEDEENWRLTHRLGGKLWVAAGVAIVVAGLVLDGPVLTAVALSIIDVATVVPVVYSWRIFRGRKEVSKVS